MAGIINNPKATIQLLPADIVSTIAGRRDLLVGQLGAGSTAVSGELYQNIQTLTSAEIRTLFSGYSDLSYRIFKWIEGNDAHSQLDVIALTPHVSGSVGDGLINFSGTATADGSYDVSIVDEYLFKITVSVTSGDSGNDVRDAVDNTYSAMSNLPFFTTAAAPGVLVSARDKGTIGNSYGWKVVGTVPGLTVGGTAITGGANNPTLTNIFDPVDGIRYTGLLWPEMWASDLSIATTEFDNRFNANDTIMDGVVFHGKTDTFANNLTFIGTENSQSLVVGGNNLNSASPFFGPAIMTPADWALSYFMGVRAKRLTIDAPIGNDVIAVGGSLDAIGGPELASLPYFNSLLPNVSNTQPIDLFSSTEQNSLEDAGFTVYGANDSGTIIMGPVVTAWTTDDAGNPNTSFHYLNYIDTGSACREIFYNNLKSAYSQCRLSIGDLIAGRSMVNAEGIKAFLLKIYKQLTLKALTKRGSEAESFFAQNTTVELDLPNRAVTISSKLPIVTQWGSTNYALQLTFTTNE